MKNPLWKEIGHRVQLTREKLKLLQKDMAKELEISNASLSEIEAGNKKPRFELLYNFSKKFNVNLVYLLHGTGDMFLPGHLDYLAQVRQTGATGEQAEFLENFLKYFTCSRLVRYSVMAFFTSFLLQNEQLIEKDFRDGKENTD